MPEQAHSAEPWSLKRVAGCDRVHDANGRDLEYASADGFDQRDIRRIVACVNFCQGLSTEELEAYREDCKHPFYSLNDLTDGRVPEWPMRMRDLG
jgi:hypothetical protein